MSMPLCGDCNSKPSPNKSKNLQAINALQLSSSCVTDPSLDGTNSHESILKIENIYFDKNIVQEREIDDSLFCYICYDNVIPSAQTPIVKLSCGHEYCRDCFKGYIHNKVIDGQINLTCFHPVNNPESKNNINQEEPDSKTCNYQISNSEIEEALFDDKETLSKYQRFYLLKGSSNMRECSQCCHIQAGDPNHPMTTCRSCNDVYCFYHDKAHGLNETCAQYEAKIKESQKNTLEYVTKISKPCPKCGIAIGKIDGCNHMKCPVCNQAFCWLCGKAIEDTVFPAHFQWWNPVGCSNLQMNDSIEPSRFTKFCARILTIIELLILGPLTLASTAASLVLCSCCVPHLILKGDESKTTTEKAQEVGSMCMSGWGMFWIGIVFFIPAAVILLALVIAVAAAAFALLYPVYAVLRLCSGKYPWPDRVTALFKVWFDHVAIGCVQIRHMCCCIFHEGIRMPRPEMDINRSSSVSLKDEAQVISITPSSRRIDVDHSKADLAMEKV